VCVYKYIHTHALAQVRVKVGGSTTSEVDIVYTYPHMCVYIHKYTHTQVRVKVDVRTTSQIGVDAFLPRR